MNIACHSSFENNLRVRVATPTGHKDLQAKSPMGKSNHLPQAAPAASVPASSDTGDASALRVHNPYNTAVDTNVWDTQIPSALLGHHQRTDFDSALLSDPWSFSIPHPASPSLQAVPCAQTGFSAAESSIYSPVYFDQSAMGMPYFYPCNPDFSSDSETSSFMNAQSQEGMSGDAWFQCPTTSHPRS
jgi:hypothetical protein